MVLREKVTPNSIAAKAGIKPQDEIISLNNRKTLNWPSIAMGLMRYYGETTDLTITTQSANNSMSTQHMLKINSANWRLDNLRPDLIKSIGIEPYIPAKLNRNKEGKIILPNTLLQRTQYNVLSALAKAMEETIYFISFNSIVLYKMVTGVISWQGLSGPVSIFQAASGAAQQGIIIYFNFLALISISIGLLNLLPIPGLDGAQIVYLLYELVRGKPMSIVVQVLTFRLGIILLIIIMLQALANDLLRLK